MILGDGLHGPSRSKFKQVLHAGPEGMVSEEGKENSTFSKFRSIAHGGLGLSLNCSPGVEIEALQDHENFLRGFQVHLKIKEWAFKAMAVGFYDGPDDAHHVGGPDLGVIVALESSMRRCPINATALSLMAFCQALQGEFVVATNKGIFAV
jgi:hypothetical protein